MLSQTLFQLGLLKAIFELISLLFNGAQCLSDRQLLIANGYQYLLSNEYWISFFPGLALLGTIVAINLVGDQLRDVLNPRQQR